MQINDSKTVSIRNFNRSVLCDPRVSISMVDVSLRLSHLTFFLLHFCSPFGYQQMAFANILQYLQVPIGDGMTICRKN